MRKREPSEATSQSPWEPGIRKSARGTPTDSCAPPMHVGHHHRAIGRDEVQLLAIGTPSRRRAAFSGHDNGLGILGPPVRRLHSSPHEHFVTPRLVGRVCHPPSVGRELPLILIEITLHERKWLALAGEWQHPHVTARLDSCSRRYTAESARRPRHSWGSCAAISSTRACEGSALRLMSCSNRLPVSPATVNMSVRPSADHTGTSSSIGPNVTRVLPRRVVSRIQMSWSICRADDFLRRRNTRIVRRERHAGIATDIADRADLPALPIEPCQLKSLSGGRKAITSCCDTEKNPPSRKDPTGLASGTGSPRSCSRALVECLREQRRITAGRRRACGVARPRNVRRAKPGGEQARRRCGTRRIVERADVYAGALWGIPRNPHVEEMSPVREGTTGRDAPSRPCRYRFVSTRMPNRPSRSTGQAPHSAHRRR